LCLSGAARVSPGRVAIRGAFTEKEVVHGAAHATADAGETDPAHA
jgi:hypothetical protein